VLSLSMVDASCATSTAVPAASDEGGGLFRDCRATTSIGDGRRDRDQVVPNTPPSTAVTNIELVHSGEGATGQRPGIDPYPFVQQKNESSHWTQVLHRM